LSADNWLGLIVGVLLGRGKAQAATLRRTKQETVARRLIGWKPGVSADALREESVPGTALALGDHVVVEAGHIIPGDGDVVEGVASVDESAITGESAPVIRESGGDRSAVTGGSRVLSDRIIVKITSKQSIVIMVALVVALIPTTIGALLSAIGIAGMDRLVQRNVLAMSGRAVGAAGDVNTLLLDKTARSPSETGRRRSSCRWTECLWRNSPTRRSCPRWPTTRRRAGRSSYWPSSSSGCASGPGANCPVPSSSSSPRRPG
jgi:high-affinity K+ transport system ATPase subunit B